MDETIDKYIIRTRGTGFLDDVEICDVNGEPFWIGKSQRFAILWPRFTVFDTLGKELLTVERQRAFPFSRFVFLENNSPGCTVTRPNLLRNRFIIDFLNGTRSSFNMPIFKTTFRGESETGLKVEATVDRYNWNVRAEGEVNRLYLLGALAFLYRVWMKSD